MTPHPDLPNLCSEQQAELELLLKRQSKLLREATPKAADQDELRHVRVRTRELIAKGRAHTING